MNSHIAYIHIGPWKSGSTEIQHFLHENRPTLINFGIYYPEGIVDPTAHHEIPNYLMGSLSRFGEVPISHFDLSEELEKVSRELKKSSARGIMLSSEDFASLNSTQYCELISILHNLGFSKIRIIYFTFDADKRIDSFVNQYIKQGEWVQQVDKEELKVKIENLFLEIEKNLSKLISLGVEVKKISYDDARLNDNLIEKFLESIDLGDKIGEFGIVMKRLNSSYLGWIRDLHNEFNKVNNGLRPFDENAPVVFSNEFLNERERLAQYQKLVEIMQVKEIALIEVEATLVKTNLELELIKASRIWKSTSWYRKLREMISSNRDHRRNLT
jgi:hypothetical protein